jgi:hypothetical protein
LKKLIVLLAAAAVLAPVAASAGTSTSTTSARLDCTKLRAAMGTTAFSQAYPAFGSCVSAYAPVEQQSTTSAQSTCSTEQADPNFASTHGGKTFGQYYGTGKSGKNAFGNCVSSVNKANSQAEQQGRVNPAATCRATRTALGTATFDKTYGKNANDKNAFGKCVSSTAKAQAQNEVSASSSCKSQQDDPNFASSNGGKTFAQTYGTNADLSNAYGKCVSSTAKAKSTAQQQAVVNAARTCRSAQKSDPTGFKAKYKSFGKCVSAQVEKSQQA